MVVAAAGRARSLGMVELPAWILSPQAGGEA